MKGLVGGEGGGQGKGKGGKVGSEIANVWDLPPPPPLTHPPTLFLCVPMLHNKSAKCGFAPVLYALLLSNPPYRLHLVFLLPPPHLMTRVPVMLFSLLPHLPYCATQCCVLPGADWSALPPWVQGECRHNVIVTSTVMWLLVTYSDPITCRLCLLYWPKTTFKGGPCILGLEKNLRNIFKPFQCMWVQGRWPSFKVTVLLQSWKL